MQIRYHGEYYPLHTEVAEATMDQVEEWYFNLRKPLSKNERAIFSKISGRYYECD